MAINTQVNPVYQNSGSVTIPLTGNSNSSPSDSNVLFINSTANNYTKTILSGMVNDFGFAMIQGSTGTCTIAAAAGVTLIGSTLSTSAAGGLICAIWIANDTYVIKSS